MAFRLLATGGCTNGTCPTWWQDDETGDVKVRGFHPDHPGDSTYERDVVIPAATWTRLVAQLPR